MAHILVVEDEKPISDLITMNLKLIGHSYTKAYDSAVALKLIEDGTFDLILMDVMLPNIDGFELAKRSRDNNARKTPIIFITAKDALADRINGFELGADDYIIKPFETLELLARINVALRRNGRVKVLY